MSKKGNIVPHHKSRTLPPIRVGFRQTYEQGNLSELVGAACDLWLLKKGLLRDAPFNYFVRKP